MNKYLSKIFHEQFDFAQVFLRYFLLFQVRSRRVYAGCYNIDLFFDSAVDKPAHQGKIRPAAHQVKLL